MFCPHRALTEKIVSVLPKMKCPHRLEPHQIQGLDFIHIFPVVQVRQAEAQVSCWTDRLDRIYNKFSKESVGIGFECEVPTVWFHVAFMCCYTFVTSGCCE